MNSSDLIGYKESEITELRLKVDMAETQAAAAMAASPRMRKSVHNIPIELLEDNLKAKEEELEKLRNTVNTLREEQDETAETYADLIHAAGENHRVDVMAVAAERDEALRQVAGVDKLRDDLAVALRDVEALTRLMEQNKKARDEEIAMLRGRSGADSSAEGKLNLERITLQEAELDDVRQKLQTLTFQQKAERVAIEEERENMFKKLAETEEAAAAETAEAFERIGEAEEQSEEARRLKLVTEAADRDARALIEAEKMGMERLINAATTEVTARVTVELTKTHAADLEAMKGVMMESSEVRQKHAALLARQKAISEGNTAMKQASMRGVLRRMASAQRSKAFRRWKGGIDSQAIYSLDESRGKALLDAMAATAERDELVAAAGGREDEVSRLESSSTLPSPSP